MGVWYNTLMFSRKTTEKSPDLFYISSSDWEVVLGAENEVEAATKALEEKLTTDPQNTNISTVILALNISQSISTADPTESLHILYSPKILANAGFHEESKRLQELIEEIKVLS